jgi:hypothetical protein
METVCFAETELTFADVEAALEKNRLDFSGEEAYIRLDSRASAMMRRVLRDVEFQWSFAWAKFADN